MKITIDVLFKPNPKLFVLEYGKKIMEGEIEDNKIILTDNTPFSTPEKGNPDKITFETYTFELT